METIPREKCIKVGFIQKPHGVSGELVIKSSEGIIDCFEDYPTLYLEIEGLLVPYFITVESLRYKSNDSVIIGLDWVDNERKAKELSGASVYIDEKQMVINDSGSDPDFFIGFQIEDETKGILGEVIEVKNYSGNVLFEIKHKNGELLIPFHDDFLIKIDKKKKILKIRVPEGLL